MKRYCLALTFAAVLLSLANPVNAQPWEFSAPIDVTIKTGSGIYHHLESSGRRNIAVSGKTVAVAWEDNRSGSPQIYIAFKPGAAREFTAAIKMSSGKEAFEPSLVALDGERFAIAWEQDGRIHARIVSAKEQGPALATSPVGAAQASLDFDANKLTLVYSRQDGPRQRVWLQQLEINGDNLRGTKDCAIDAEQPKEDQLYPTSVRVGDRTIVAWEDRRLGHTNIMGAESRDAVPCRFTTPQRITEQLPRMSTRYGRGRGAARVALARYAGDQVLAVWADKRDFLEGYDIYTANLQENKPGQIGKNMKVQDDFGGNAHQWHAAVASDGIGKPVVAWDDKREGNANIMVSWREGDRWSDDLAVPGASGPAEQAHPSIYIDKDQQLHVVWVERATVGGTTRLRYTVGRAVKP